MFHENYCKFRRKDPKVNDSSIGVPCEEYQIIFEYGSVKMQVNRVKFHKYLGMALDYTTVGQVNITILNYIDEIMYAFDQVDPTVVGTNSSAAPAIIFKVDKYCKKLNTK